MIPGLGPLDPTQLITGGMSLIGQASTNRANARLARQQMDFQERMSSTAHQREVADLRSAGLNPILSGTGGHGSSTPPGATAEMRDPITAGINTAVSSKLHSAQTKEAEARARRESSVADVVEEASKLIVAGIGGVKDLSKLGAETFAELQAMVQKWLDANKMPSLPSASDLARMVRDALGISPTPPMPAAKRIVHGKAGEETVDEDYLREIMGLHSSRGARERVRLGDLHRGGRDPEVFKSGRDRGVNWRRRPHHLGPSR